MVDVPLKTLGPLMYELKSRIRDQAIQVKVNGSALDAKHVSIDSDGVTTTLDFVAPVKKAKKTT